MTYILSEPMLQALQQVNSTAELLHSAFSGALLISDDCVIVSRITVNRRFVSCQPEVVECLIRKY